MVYMKDIGKACGDYRRKKHITQKHIATKTGYNIRTISSFERGGSNNAIILLWYIMNGFDIRGVLNGKVKDSNWANNKRYNEFTNE